jgi:RNA polymerase sigma factor (sigma-70 family)
LGRFGRKCSTDLNPKTASTNVNGADEIYRGTGLKCTRLCPKEKGAKYPSKIAKHCATSATKVIQIPLTGIGAGKHQKSKSKKDKMSTTDVTIYDQIILTCLSSVKIQAQQRDDLKQECYVALLQRWEELKDGNFDLAKAICQTTIERSRKSETRLKKNLDSLSVPQVMNKAMKKYIQEEEGITEEQLQEAIRLLPYEEYKIVYSLYVEGKTQAQIGKEYGISQTSVHRKAKRGIIALKKHFEV